jgi:DNA repair protein RecO (recombination protein O)
MITESEGIVLRQTKISGGRRMVSIFTKRYGKISAGTNITERSRGKQALALRPFTHGTYEFFKRGDYFNINGGDAIHSYYRIGEDVEKYMNASFALELVDKVTVEGQPAPGVFNLTLDLMKELERRKERHRTLIAAFTVKLMKQLGVFPVLGSCAVCGASNAEGIVFSIPAGGVVCREHASSEAAADSGLRAGAAGNDPLIYNVDFGIIDILEYFDSHPLESLRKVALDEAKAEMIRKMMTAYARYHLDIGEMKSESFMTV